MSRSLLVVACLMLMPGLALAATPAEGVPLKVRRGFFTETDIGTFFTLGGADNYSNAQTYLQLGLGYDVGQYVELGLHVGIGSSAANCFGNRDDAENCFSDFPAPPPARGFIALPADFTMTFVDLTVAGLIKIFDRFYFTPKFVAGWTLLDPAPVLADAATPVTQGPNAGVGIGLEYATYMDHFSIGLDAVFRFVIGPNISTVAIFPRVKYTF